MSKRMTFIVMSLTLAALSTPKAQEHPDAIIKALRNGGYVIVLRHARSPREMPDERTAHPDNSNRERQLDEVGRADAVALGNAIRDLGIPVGRVLTSPAFRALETVRLAGWLKPQVADDLGDRGQSMQGVTEGDAAFLRQRVLGPSGGANTILVTHLPNITRAFPDHAQGVDDGDALVFRPEKGAATLIGLIKVSDWGKRR